LINELNFVSQGRKIKLYVAAELVLETIINKYFLGRDADLNDKLLIEIPDDLTASDEPIPTETTSIAEAPPKKSALFVTDEEYAASLLESILSREGYDVIVVDSLEKAAQEIAGQSLHAVFIREGIDGNCDQLIETIRKGSPRTIVQVYKTAASLVMHDEAFAIAEDILTKNLSLFTSLLSSKDNLPHNHSAMVGQYSDKLCRKLGLPSRDKMFVVMAAYLHDLARYYYPDQNGGKAPADPAKSIAGQGGAGEEDYKGIIESSRKLLGSFEYSGPIIGILSSMYKDLKGDNHLSASLEVLGGNIITIVDLFCENIAFDRHFTLDKFDAIKKRLRDFIGKLFFPEVVEAFIGMIQEEILNLQTTGLNGRIRLYSDDPRATYPLLLRLKNEGFQAISSENMAAVIADKGKADVFVFYLKMNHERITDFIKELNQSGFDLKTIPSVLIVENGIISKLGWLYERGVEDIMSEDLSIDLMILKLRKLLGRINKKTAVAPESNMEGAKGRLADMNLIDLMQALAPGRRTVKITVYPTNAPSEKLTIFLDKGVISYAQLGNLIGAEAIYEGMIWTDGAWTVEPVTHENLPPSNNTISNDGILMEGAYRLDEKMRAGKL